MKATPLRKLILGAILLIIALFSLGLSLAEEELKLDFKLSIDPSNVSKPSQVKVKVEIKNLGDKDIEVPLTLYDAEDKTVRSFFTNGTLSKIKKGETKKWNGTYRLKQEQLENGRVVFNLRYPVTNENGESSSVSIPAEAQINYFEEKVALDIQRTHTPDVFRKGNEVKVSYKLTNNGNINLENISIREHASISGKDEKIKTLKPGQSKTITFTKKGKTSDLVSHPVIKYRIKGNTKYEVRTLDKLVIPYAKPNLKVLLSASETNVSIGDTTTLKFTFKNEGNISYTATSVKSTKLGEVFKDIEIPAKQTVEKSFDIKMNKTETFLFEVKLKDNSGKEQTEKTNSLKVSAYDPAKITRVNLDLSADRENIDAQPGQIFLKLVVTNNSNFDVKGLKVYYRGVKIYSVPTLAPGESRTYEREFLLSQPGQVRFEAKVEDYLKNTVTFESNTLQIGYKPKTAAPTKKPIVTLEPLVTHTPVPNMPESTGDGLGTAKNIFQILLIIFGGIFIASTVSRFVFKKIKENRSVEDESNLSMHSYLSEESYTGIDEENIKEADSVSNDEETEPSDESEEEQPESPVKADVSSEEAKDAEFKKPNASDVAEEEKVDEAQAEANESKE